MVNKPVLVASVALFTVIAASCVVWLLTNPFDEDRSRVCSSSACMEAAKVISDNMDKRADPCKDFYTYSCGGWIKNHPIEKHASRISQFTLLNRKTRKILKDILSKESTNDTRDAFNKARMYYKSCMNEEEVESQKSKPIFELIKNLGGVPLLGERIKGRSLEKYLARVSYRVAENYLAQISSPVITMRMEVDPKNTNGYIIELDQGYLGMPNRDNYLPGNTSRKMLPKYREYMRNFFELLLKDKQAIMSHNLEKEIPFDCPEDEAECVQIHQGLSRKRHLDKEIEKIIELETALAKILEPAKNRSDVLQMYRKMTIRELNEKTPHFDWFMYINAVLEKVGKRVDRDADVIARGLPYFENLGTVLKKFKRSVIRNFAIWLVLRDNIQYMSKKYRDTKASYNLALAGTNTDLPRWESCVNSANTLLPMVVGGLFVKETFPSISRTTMMTMINNVITAFKHELNKIDWMDKETKIAAERKADAVEKLIGYPDYTADDKNPKLDMDIEKLVVKQDELLANSYRIKVHQLKENLRRLETIVDRNVWDETAPGYVDAFYNKKLNQMIYPAAVLQPPFFGVGYPYGMNYGMIGTAIGHELTHGFDVQGSRFNEFGKLENWWTNFSRTNFESKTECIKDQYSQYYYKAAQMNVDGQRTLGENIADNGGIRAAYQGYQIWKKHNPGKEFELPGLENYTPEQLFFIGHAQIWCNSENLQAAQDRIKRMSHSPQQFRVEGTLRNFAKFGEAFKCKRGIDLYYPSDVCRVW